jgi:hypothetical protein
MDNFSSNNVMLDGVLAGKLRADLDDIFEVESVEIPRQLPPGLIWPIRRLGRQAQEEAERQATQGVILFMGRLRQADSEAVYDIIAERWRAHDYTPLLRHYKGQVTVVAQPGTIGTPKPTNPWINVGLAVATILAVWLTGALYECQCAFPTTPAHWLTGLPMMLTMMVILLAHEFGHYFAARYHRVAVTLPYFIPLPILSPVGTLGAFIQLRSPFKTKKQLFDIGIAGPLAGLIFAIPLIFWGIASSEIHTINRSEASVLEGNSIFYLGVKYFLYGQLLPSFEQYANLPAWQEFALVLMGIIPQGGGTDILINSVAFAAWFGLFVTAMNLMPVGQLDGGHLAYTILGDKARWLGMALVAVMVAAGVFWWTGWLVWAMLIFFIIGTGHPPPLNALVELGLTRKIIAYLTLILFILLFMPNPLQPM